MAVVYPTKNCVICGKEYRKKATVSRSSWANSRFCSRRCVGIGRAPWNKNTKGRQSAWNKGRPIPQLSGDKNGAWKGGGAKYHRRKTLERDDWTCQSCGHREPDIMQVDHISPKSVFPLLNFVASNLVTLCPNCHARKSVEELRGGISHMGRVKPATLL